MRYYVEAPTNTILLGNKEIMSQKRFSIALLGLPSQLSKVKAQGQQWTMIKSINDRTLFSPFETGPRLIVNSKDTILSS